MKSRSKNYESRYNYSLKKSDIAMKNTGRNETSCSISLEGLYTMWTKSIRYCSSAEYRGCNSASGGPNSELPINSRRESNRVALEWAATEETKHTWDNCCYTELNRVLQFTLLASHEHQIILIDNFLLVISFMFAPRFLTTFPVFVNNRKFRIMLHQ